MIGAQSIGAQKIGAQMGILPTNLWADMSELNIVYLFILSILINTRYNCSDSTLPVSKIQYPFRERQVKVGTCRFIANNNSLKTITVIRINGSRS